MVGIFGNIGSFDQLPTLDFNAIVDLQQTRSIFQSASFAANTASRQTASVFDTKSYQLELNDVNTRTSKINNLLDGYTNANSAIKSAEEGLDKIEKLLQEAEGLAEKSLKANSSLSASTTSSAFSTSNFNNLTLISTDNGSGGTFEINSGDKFSLSSGDGPSAILEIDDDTTAQELVDKINQYSFFSAEIVDSKLSIKTLDGGDLNATNIVGESLNALGLDTGTTVAIEDDTANQVRENEEVKYNQILDKIKDAIKESGHEFTNLLSGSRLEISLNENSNNKFNIRNSKLSLDRLGLEKANFDGLSNVQSSIDAISDAVQKIKSVRSQIESSSDIVNDTQRLQEELIEALKTERTDLEEKIEIFNDKSALEAARKASSSLANEVSAIGQFNTQPALLQFF